MKYKDYSLLREAYQSIIEQSLDVWGSSKQPYWRPGPNPTVDLVLIYNNKILLIKRGEGGSEANKWAIPGGFIDTSSKKGEPFRMDKELPKQAALRELEEETGLDLTNTLHISSRMREVGVYEGDQRDPRDNKKAWSRSHVFALILTDDDGIDINRVRGFDDASDAHWFNINKLPSQIAFDHHKIIKDALLKIGKLNCVHEGFSDDFTVVSRASAIKTIVDKSGLCKADSRERFINAIQKAIELFAGKYELDNSEQVSIINQLHQEEFITNEQFSKLIEKFKPKSFFSTFFNKVVN